MLQHPRSLRPSGVAHLPALAVAILLGMAASPPSAGAQDAAQTGSVGGRVVDEQGTGIGGAQVYLIRPAISAQTRADGGYTLDRVPAGARVLHVRMLGFRPDSASISVTAGERTAQDFTLLRDPLQLQTMVVTGTTTPRQNLAASVAVTTLTAQEVEDAAPR
ncbi:MAG TPA: carboxypeptidase regulatory-like domain-containing protein, partial [Gemmatimonadales bacterium]|nr:carboxypeptidase regulatory-like domain-containing protein [Gemmatimonadales bacterium]